MITLDPRIFSTAISRVQAGSRRTHDPATATGPALPTKAKTGPKARNDSLDKVAVLSNN